ncbi:MFS transporter [Allokutzneria sp. A3M-2-11 16]|uniref:MFS transporter n=1 Tax=Allokutzneria sp. A3M-2-11 16 TaxID=2962043 RepID=UPI0020B8D920|nr:MFS transporter [Allokutzneria sp. A3M-2-11 16]MCP3803641.1 MFS transporter [Allokutzneria sp. A3M-2-11 16]
MPDATVAVPAAVRTARRATSLVFGMHAGLFAAWTPHIPLVKERLAVGDGVLGLLLLGAPIGALLAILAAGPMIARWGSRPMMMITAVGYGGVSFLLGLAGSGVALFLALMVWGAFQSALDVAMNAQAVLVERHYDRPVMSSFHGFWSLGGFVGAGVGALAVGANVGLTVQMLVLGVLLVVVVFGVNRVLLTGDHAGDTEADAKVRTRDVLRDGRLLALGALMFAALLCEGAAADWAAIYLRDWLGTTASFAGAGYSVFAIAMFVGRGLGDRWVARYGPRLVVGGLSVLAAVVFAAGLAVAQPWAALLGFAALGLGVACGVPVVFSSAAELPGRHAAQSIAAVSAIAWPGFLLGPTAIGGLSEAVTLPFALILLPVLCLAIGLGARLILRGRR